METKAELLEHYATKEPKEFYRVDGFYSPESLGVDPLYHAVPHDSDGDCIMSGERTELMTGAWAVRVLIPESTSKETAIRILEKIKKSIERYGVLSEYRAGASRLDKYVDRRRKLRIVGKVERRVDTNEVPF